MFVKVIDRCRMARLCLLLGVSAGGKQRLDDLLAQAHQRRHRSQTVRFRLIAASGPDLANYSFAPQLFEIVGGAPRPITGETPTLQQLLASPPNRNPRFWSDRPNRMASDITP
jgi:hypothetical protein